jgi:hypothetical protein
MSFLLISGANLAHGNAICNGCDLIGSCRNGAGRLEMLQRIRRLTLATISDIPECLAALDRDKRGYRYENSDQIYSSSFSSPFNQISFTD